MSFFHAPILKLGRILEERDVSDNILDQWKRAFLTTLFTFKVLPVTTARFAALQIREDFNINGAVVDYTALQRIVVVLKEWATMSRGGTVKVTAKQVADELDHVRMAPPSYKSQQPSLMPH